MLQSDCPPCPECGLIMVAEKAEGAAQVTLRCLNCPPPVPTGDDVAWLRERANREDRESTVSKGHARAERLRAIADHLVAAEREHALEIKYLHEVCHAAQSAAADLRRALDHAQQALAHLGALAVSLGDTHRVDGKSILAVIETYERATLAKPRPA